jgi:glycosidase
MGQLDVNALYIYYSWNEKAYPRDIMRMTFVSNHDKNAWEGTEFEQFGECVRAAIALSVVGEGMPLIYNGQEAGNDRRLAFFEKDPIVWREHPLGDLYRRLFALKHQNTALWNAAWGARMINAPNSAPERVLSFVRRNDRDAVFAVFNLSALSQTVTFSEALHHGTYTDYFTGETVTFAVGTRLSLEPWSFRIYAR